MSDAPVPPPPAPGPGPAPLGSDERNWGLIAHLSAFAAAFVGIAVLGPLVVWLVKKDDHPFVAEHAREALNFQLTWLIGGFVGGIVAFVFSILTIGFGLLLVIPLLVVAFILWVWWTIKAAMAASRGEMYRYPLTARLIS